MDNKNSEREAPSLTPEQLAEAVAEYMAKYDAMVTEGERLAAERRKIIGDYKFLTEGFVKLKSYTPSLDDWKRSQSDSVTIIRQLWADRAANRAVMEQARDALGKAWDGTYYPGSEDFASDITALNEALGRV